VRDKGVKIGRRSRVSFARRLTACKAYFDGIADAIGINDSRFQHQAPVWGIPRKGGNVRVILEAI
jgi:hypothetical protein